MGNKKKFKTITLFVGNRQSKQSFKGAKTLTFNRPIESSDLVIFLLSDSFYFSFQAHILFLTWGTNAKCIQSFLGNCLASENVIENHLVLKPQFSFFAYCTRFCRSILSLLLTFAKFLHKILRLDFLDLCLRLAFLSIQMKCEGEV